MKNWKPSKADALDYAKKMEEIENFCNENKISSSYSKDSYYFNLNGKEFRVSNHSVESRVEWAENNRGEVELVSKEDSTRKKDIVYIHAGKTRIIEIYNNLKAGKELDGRGNVKNN